MRRDYIYNFRAKVVEKSDLILGPDNSYYFKMVVDNGKSKMSVVQWFGGSVFFPIVHVDEEYYFLQYMSKTNIPEFSGIPDAPVSLHANSSSRLSPASLVTNQEPEKERTLETISAQKLVAISLKNPEKFLAEIPRLPEILFAKILGLLNYKEAFDVYYQAQKVIPSLLMTTICNNFEYDLTHALRNHPTQAIPNDCYLHDVFANINLFKFTTRDQHEIDLPKIFTRGDKNTTKNSPIVPSMEEFKRRFHIFTGGLLEGLDWTNVICAGGSVLACLLNNVPAECKTDEEISDYFLHKSPFAKSDIDLFILNTPSKSNYYYDRDIYADQIQNAYQIISQNLAKKGVSAFCCQTKSCVSIVSQFPHRTIQLVFAHSSPVFVLANFDLDCCCVGYDGKTVWASPRAIRAITRRYNLGNPLKISPSYEHRALKYGLRGFSFAFPGLDRAKVQRSEIKQWGSTILGNLLFLEQGQYKESEGTTDNGNDLREEDGKKKGEEESSEEVEEGGEEWEGGDWYWGDEQVRDGEAIGEGGRGRGRGDGGRGGRGRGEGGRGRGGGGGGGGIGEGGGNGWGNGRGGIWMKQQILPKRDSEQYSPEINWGPETTKEQLMEKMKSSPEVFTVVNDLEELINLNTSEVANWGKAYFGLTRLEINNHKTRYLPLYWVGSTLGDEKFKFEDPHYTHVLREWVFLEQLEIFGYY
eukprot:Phypoly_transcript_02570.p1 GENE.Phypoly_transcript_02570~~Phypoly_transcript_02570.p1  ORF type:complete len:781 (+),score=143.83 Phypoly_transcript_02570:254-2344(+)